MRSRSGSTTSVTSTKELSVDNIPINVTICDGKTIKLNIRPIHTVSNILEFLSASTTLATDVRLVMDGKPLDPPSTVAQLKLQESSLLKLDPPSRRSASPTQEPVAIPAAGSPTDTPTTSSTPATPTPASTSRTSTPSKRPSRPRCSKADCKALAPPIVGDCGFCQKRFCGKHRMLESHNCSGLQNARQADKDRNAAKLQSERTVMLRGL
ncbi:hypothetical protein DV738_g3053, partial [Chaetothyriales sp. CBS 135597]